MAAQPTEATSDAGSPAASDITPVGLGLALYRRREFAWKVALLAVSTVALIPILLYQDVLWAGVYTAFLIVVHIAGIVIIAVGTRRHHIAPDRRGLAIRVVGIAILTGLLYLASKGVTTDARQWVFWGSLFAIWALHTVGLALLHVRGARERTVCPFA